MAQMRTCAQRACGLSLNSSHSYLLCRGRETHKKLVESRFANCGHVISSAGFRMRYLVTLTGMRFFGGTPVQHERMKIIPSAM